jgi:hypothetical protein
MNKETLKHRPWFVLVVGWYQELDAFFDVGEAEPQTIQDTRVHLQCFHFLLLPES